MVRRDRLAAATTNDAARAPAGGCSIGERARCSLRRNGSTATTVSAARIRRCERPTPGERTTSSVARPRTGSTYTRSTRARRPAPEATSTLRRARASTRERCCPDETRPAARERPSTPPCPPCDTLVVPESDGPSFCSTLTFGGQPASSVATSASSISCWSRATVMVAGADENPGDTEGARRKPLRHL